MSRSLALAALTAGSVACWDAEEPAVDTPPAAHGEGAGAAASPGAPKTLVVGWPMDFRSLLGIVQESNEDAEITAQLVYDLVRADFRDCRLHAEPGMATEWSFSEDGRTLSMTLQDGVKWEDGKPLTVQDIARTYEIMADPKATSSRFSTADKLVPGKRPAILDATHIQWESKEPVDQGMFLFSVTGQQWVPAHALADADVSTLRAHPLSSQPLSYGPWRLESHEPNQRIVLVPNPAFTGPAEMKPKLDRVVFRILPDYQSRLGALEAGEIHHMNRLLVADAERLAKTHPNLALHRRGWRSVEFVTWNTRKPMFQDPRVRTALALGADVDTMMKSLFTMSTGETYAKRAVGTISPELCETIPEQVTPLPHDIGRAKALLAEAGWTDTNGDGIVDKDGEKLQFTLNYGAGNDRRAKEATLLQANLKEIGVAVDLLPLDPGALAGNVRSREFDAMIAGFASGLFVDPSSSWKCATPENPAEFNHSGYCNPEVDALIDRGLATPKFDDAAPLWKEMQAQLYEDQPMLFLYWMDEIVAVDKRFQNVSVDIVSSLSHLHEWEVAPGGASTP